MNKRQNGRGPGTQGSGGRSGGTFASGNCFLSGIALSFVLLAATAHRAEAQSAEQRYGAFTLHALTDPMTDENRTYIATEASAEGIDAGVLAWQCSGGKVSVALFADDYLRDATTIGAWRFDSKPPRRLQRWSGSPEGNRFYLAPAKAVREFTVDAQTAARVVVELNDYKGSVRTYVFPIEGLTAALERLPCRLP